MRGSLVWTSLLVVVSAATAQQPPESAQRRLAALTAGTDAIEIDVAYRGIRDVLRQKDGPISRVTMDSLGDGLMTLAMQQSRTKSLDHSRLVARSIAILESAGSKDARIPYAGAFSRLRYLFEKAADPGARGAALGALAGLADTDQAVAYLADVASGKFGDTRVFASRAVDHLITRLGEKGKSKLLAIHSEGSITDPDALALFQMYRANGFKPLK